MAEAASSTGPAVSPRFYCHSCSQEIEPLMPDFICGRCNMGFIEELQPAAPRRSATQTTIPEFFTEVTANSIVPETTLSQFLSGFIDGLDPRVENLQGDFIMQLQGGAIGDEQAWNPNGLYTLISHLLNQVDGQEAVLLSQQQIDAIPEVEITEAQVTANLQCSVCMEDFVLNENTRRLHCGHQFHSPCILPWLVNHITCPICRLNLNVDDAPKDTSRRPTESAGARRYQVLTNPLSPSSSTAPVVPSTSGAVPRRTYQEDDCD